MDFRKFENVPFSLAGAEQRRVRNVEVSEQLQGHAGNPRDVILERDLGLALGTSQPGSLQGLQA